MPRLSEMTVAEVRAWLIAHGHKTQKVAKTALGLTLPQRKAALDALHRAAGPHAGRKDRG